MTEKTEFKIGDKVKIKENLKVKQFSSSCPGISPEMIKFSGKKTTIKQKIYLATKNRFAYKLDIDKKEFFWTDEMITKDSRIKIS